MESNLSYEVLVKTKVPYLTAFLFYLLLAFALVFGIVYIFFLPADSAPLEMKTAYFILVVPEIVKYALVISGIGLLLIFPLYMLARNHKKALLQFLDDRITIKGDKTDIALPVSSLKRVYCMDSHTLSGQSRNNLTIYFQEGEEKTTAVRLRYYLQGEEFMERLLQYENIDFKTYDFDVNPGNDI